MFNNFDDMQKLGKDNLDSTMKALSAFSKGAQGLAAEMAEYSKKSFEDSSKAMEKLLATKTLEQAIEIQSNFAKTAYEAFVAQTTKIGELYLDCAKETYKPFETYLTKAMPNSNAGRVPLQRD